MTFSRKITLSAVLFSLVIASMLVAFRTTEQPQYMTITTVESIIPGGLGRSRVMVTYPDGKQTISNLENLYSLVGIRFENIQGNDKNITTLLNEHTQLGWTLRSVSTGVQSPNAGGSNEGIYMTRYILEKR